MFLAFQHGFQELDNCKQRGEKKQASLILWHYSYSRLEGIRKTGKQCILFPEGIRIEFGKQYISCRFLYLRRFLFRRCQQCSSLGNHQRHSWSEDWGIQHMRPLCSFLVTCARISMQNCEYKQCVLISAVENQTDTTMKQKLEVVLHSYLSRLVIKNASQNDTAVTHRRNSCYLVNDEEYYSLVCNAVQSGTSSLTSRTNVLPPSSGSKSKSSKKPAERRRQTEMNFYRNTRRYIPDDSKLHSHRSENIKSNKVLGIQQGLWEYICFKKPTGKTYWTRLKPAWLSQYSDQTKDLTTG
jgi:hypothetical protein